jgi:hypothetical protein
MSISRRATVCCRNLALGALSSRSSPSVLVGALFKMLGLFFFNTGVDRLNVLSRLSKNYWLLMARCKVMDWSVLRMLDA